MVILCIPRDTKNDIKELVSWKFAEINIIWYTVFVSGVVPPEYKTAGSPAGGKYDWNERQLFYRRKWVQKPKRPDV